ncbi:MAG: protein kinase [Myxococcota bacterium]
MLMCRECGRTYPVAEGFCPMDGTPLTPAASAAPAADGESRVGQVLDRRYRLDELIGEGGMAHVYRVTHTMIGKSLAAKVLRYEHRKDAEVVRRFLREAQIVSSIKHPNVVDTSDYGEMDDGGAYCVMELLRGRTLAERIDDDGAMTPEEALGIALQICQGLQVAHEAGVVHRDLKPQNVFVCDAKPGKDATVKLIDFGVARAGQRITVAGAVLGTPEYMSPEQVRGEDVDAGADLYALGVMLFEMLCAAVPFASDDVAVTMQSHLVAEPPALTVVDPNLATLQRTQALIHRLMAKIRADRPATAAEVGALLQQAMEADIGEDAAARVVRSTLALGSGGIADKAPVPAPTSRPWADRQMAWNPEPQSESQSKPNPVEAPLETTVEHDPEPPRRGASLPIVVAATALLAAGGTLGVYAVMGGFAARSTPAAPAAEPAVEIVSAPVPQPAEPSQEPAPAAGAKPEGNEQNPPGSSSVPPTTKTVDAKDASPPPTAKPRERATPKNPTRTRPRRAKRASGSNADRTAKASGAAPAAPPPDKPAADPPAPAADQSKSEAPAKPSQRDEDGDLRNPFG